MSRNQKSKLRKEALLKRNKLSSAEIEEKSQAIVDKIIEIPAYKTCTLVLSYIAFGSEVDLEKLHRRVLEDGKRLAVPRVVDKTSMDFVEIRENTTFEKSAYGIMEPVGDPIEIDEKTLVVVPGVAFDHEGRRIGYGGGYYDRVISLLKDDDNVLEFVGVFFDLQQLEVIPAEAFDETLDLLLTESQVISRNN